MISGALLLAFLTLQRAVEVAIATVNTRVLLQRGAYERAAGQYPLMIALHVTWLAAMWLWGRERAVAWPFIAAFVLLQAGRVWTMAALGRRWTTRVIISPGLPRVVSGPYRFTAHPNYLIVALEIPCVTLALGLRWQCAVFSLLNLAMLTWRVRAEERAFAEEARATR